jgi:hypothetical protein
LPVTLAVLATGIGDPIWRTHNTAAGFPGPIFNAILHGAAPVDQGQHTAPTSVEINDGFGVATLGRSEQIGAIPSHR